MKKVEKNDELTEASMMFRLVAEPSMTRHLGSCRGRQFGAEVLGATNMIAVFYYCHG